MIALLAAALLAAQPVIGLGDAVRALQSGRLDQARDHSRRGRQIRGSGRRGRPAARRSGVSIGDYAAALDRYQRLAALHPQELLTLERVGIAAVHIGDIRRASAALKTATLLPGASWRAWNGRGAAADLRRDWADADLAYGQALELPRNARRCSTIAAGR